MADKVTTSNYIEVNTGFIDEDTRKIKVPNAKSSFSTSDFTSLDAALKPTIDGAQINFLVGDRNGAEYTGILYADKVTQTKVDFDIKN